MNNLQSEVKLAVSSSENYSQDFRNVLTLSYITSVTEESHAVFFLKKTNYKSNTHTVLRDSKSRQHVVQDLVLVTGRFPGIIQSHGRQELSRALPECLGSSWPAAHPLGREGRGWHVRRGDGHPQRDELETLLLPLVGPAWPELAN